MVLLQDLNPSVAEKESITEDATDADATGRPSACSLLIAPLQGCEQKARFHSRFLSLNESGDTASANRLPLQHGDIVPGEITVVEMETGLIRDDDD
jgi:hypothetical protein